VFEALAGNEYLGRDRASQVIARIGPEGIEWRRDAPGNDEFESPCDTTDDSFTEARRAQLMSSLLEEQRRLERLHEEQEKLRHIAQKRGPGSLHDDLKLPDS